jgi:hypothetical protein
MSRHVETSVNMAQRAIIFGHLGVGIVERSQQVVILPGVFLVRKNIITKFGLCTLAPKTDIMLKMM